MNGSQYAALGSPILVIGFVSILMAWILCKVYLGISRQKRIGKIAESMGLTAYRSSQALLSEEGFDIKAKVFQNGLMRGMNLMPQVSNLMYAKNDGLTICVFDHRSGDLSSVCQTIVAIVSPDLDTPWFDLSLSGILNDGFYEDFAKGLLNYFEQYPDTHVQGKGDTMLTFVPAKRFSPDQYKELFGRGLEIYNTLSQKSPQVLNPV